MQENVLTPHRSGRCLAQSHPNGISKIATWVGRVSVLTVKIGCVQPTPTWRRSLYFSICNVGIELDIYEDGVAAFSSIQENLDISRQKLINSNFWRIYIGTSHALID